MRWINLFAGVLGVLLLLMGCMGADESVTYVSPSRPNIIFVLTDDQEVRSLAHMSAVQELLMAEGVTFDNFFVSTPTCCPSRITFLRGQYAHNHAVQTNLAPHGGFLKAVELGVESETMATWLQAAGYKTALLGKYLNEYPADDPAYIPAGWTEWYAWLWEKDRPETEDGYYNYRFNENGAVVSYRGEYISEVIAEKATTLIEQSATTETPLFLYINARSPHLPTIPAIAYQGDFADEVLPRYPSYNEMDMSDKPAYMQTSPLFKDVQEAQIDELYRDHLRTMASVDDMIAQLVETLDATGQLDDTYIVYASDNGWHFGEHRIVAGKGTPYDESVRVPLIVRGPGVPAGAVVSHLAMNTDLAPTFVSWAGGDVPAWVDGRSLEPLLSPSPPSLRAWRQSALIEFWYVFEEQLFPAYQGVRTADHLYVEYNDGERELYDLRVDPYQMDNIYATADQTVLNIAATRLDMLRTCQGEACLLAENLPLE